jgi:uncharacterized membrane protein
MKADWRAEIAMLAIIAAMFVAAAAVWPSAPDAIPVHWNASGQVDRYGGRFEGLILLPLIALSFYLLLRYLPLIDPLRANYARFGGAYLAIRVAVLLLIAGIHAMVIAWVLQRPVDMSRAVPASIGALFVLLGSILGRVKPNWFVGIRTPWTLSSKRSWERTHRLGGRLFLALGVLLLVTGLVGLGSFGLAVFGAMAGVLIILVVYSYFVWREDPERQAAGTSRRPDDV